MRCLSLALAALIAASPALAQERVVVAGGALTEIVVALGQLDRVVGRDSTSTWPEEVLALPDVGYVRALSPEGLLALNPDLILADAGSGPPETIAVIEAAQVPFVHIEAAYDEAGVLARIDQVSAALGVDGAALRTEVEAGFRDLAEARAARTGAPVRAMFIISAAGGRINASGRGTAADGMIALAGAVNVIDEFEGYRQLNDEAVAAAAPEVIIMMDRAGDHALSDEQILSHPALVLTPAAQGGRVVRMDGLYLLGFGPRTPAAARDLMDALGG